MDESLSDMMWREAYDDARADAVDRLERITPEMIKAGVERLLELQHEVGSDNIVRAIYLAMLKAGLPNKG